MKKNTLWLFLLIGFVSFSQINISQSFPNNTTPPGWNIGGGSFTVNQTCATSSWRIVVRSTSSTTTNFLSSETFVSTGQPLNVSFSYKVVDGAFGTVATSPYNGTIVLETSYDNGVTYGNGVVVVNNANHTVATTCANKSVIIPSTSVPYGSDTKIRFKCNFGTSGDYIVFLDNIVITQAAASPCSGTPVPGNTLVNNLCYGSPATLSLQNSTLGSGVTYQWFMNSVAIGGANLSTYTTPSVTTNGTYYCEVTCGGNTTASNPLLVTPSVLSSPLLEPFATFLPSCWLNMTGGDLVTGPTTTSTGSGWVIGGFANSATTGAIKNEIYSTGANDWVISPLINIPATNYELKFFAAATEWNNTIVPTNVWESDDYIEVLVATGGSTTNWTVLHTYDDTNQPLNTGSPNILDLDAYVGQDIRIAFHAVEGATNGLADIDFSIDNFQIRVSPLCTDQTGLVVGAITTTSANTSWDNLSTSGSIGYEYAVTTSATPPASGTLITNTYYIASGLSPQTVYYLHVRSLCSGSTYGNWTTISFTTLVAASPSNDNCASAIALTPGATFTTNPLIAANVGATGSTETAPGCASYTGGDVWYSVVVPASGNITIETDTNSGTTITDTGLAVYSGACGALSLVLCDDNNGTGSFSSIVLTGRTPGEVLKVRAWENGNNVFNTFQISAYDTTLSSTSFDKSTFVAYPNPVKDVLNLSYKTAISNVKIVNLLGQEVLNTKTNANDVQVNMSALTAGAYIVNITVEDTVHTIKVIKE